MQTKLRLSLASAATALLLAGCAQFERNAPQAAAVDDDALCRAQGERGSPPYVACMKDRDVAASRGNERIERAHRNLAEDMLNNRH